MKINFIEAIKKSQIDVLKKNKKFCIVGIEVSYEKLGFKSKFPKQVFEMPVSEASINGFAVGLATHGYKPFVHHGRVEFAMLGFDQIFTQASKWNYMFGGGYPCPVSFKISLGRREGDGPQHTDGYHSLFLQSNNLDIYIPSTPQEAYNHIVEISKSKNPSIFLEHRRLYLITQSFKKKFINESSFKVYGKNKNILLITYGDGLIDCLIAKQILDKINFKISVISITKFLSKNKKNKKLLKEISLYKNIIFFDTRPFDFGPLNSILGFLVKDFKKIKFNTFIISPKNTPAPSSYLLMKKYYPTSKNIVDLVLKILKKKNKPLIKLDKNYLYNFPKLDLDSIF